jgi:hypothetical protein
MLLELRSGRLDERPVMDTGRTHGFARPAIQALVHLLIELGIEQVEPAVRYGFHEPESAARRGGFFTGQAIRWACRQAHAAMNTRSQEIVIGNILTRESIPDEVDERNSH